MTEPSLFDRQTPLPDGALAEKSKTLIGFKPRYEAVRDQLRLLIDAGKLPEWNKKHHSGRLEIGTLTQDQYPFVIFHGDVGTGKSAFAECISNQLVAESRAEDSILFKLSNRVRGAGMVGQMGTFISQAFHEVIETIGKTRRAILIIDEGDSLAASRSQDHSHHEDKVGVNTLIQHIDELRQYNGRVLVILCTNRLSVLDPALLRRAAVVAAFARPNVAQRRELLMSDLKGLEPTTSDIEHLVTATGEKPDRPGWTYSDIRTRLYPTALAQAYPDHPLTMKLLLQVAGKLAPSPVMEDK